jgi:hypothetical protein
MTQKSKHDSSYNSFDYTTQTSIQLFESQVLSNQIEQKLRKHEMKRREKFKV